MLWRSPLRSVRVLSHSSLPSFSSVIWQRGIQSNVKLAPRVNHATLLQGMDSGESENLITISGLVRSTRKHKSVAFAWINDGSTLANIQAVISPEVAKDIDTGAYVSLVGKWVASLGGRQTHEFAVERVEAIGTGNATVSEKPPVTRNTC
jgi:aspartyl/asparaginyl-tRNA synthetase